MQTIYIVGGYAGMGKTSRILPSLCHERKIFPIELDEVRKITTGLITGEGIGIESMSFEGKAIFTQRGKHGDQVKEFEIKDKGEDYFAWLGTLGFIKRIPPQIDIVIVGVFNGVALTPQDVRNFEITRRDVRIRAAFVAYNTKARDNRPEKIARHYDDYEDIVGGDRLKKQVEDMRLPNYKYFDLIRSVPSSRRDQNPVPLEQVDFDTNAASVVRYLLEY